MSTQMSIHMSIYTVTNRGSCMPARISVHMRPGVRACACTCLRTCPYAHNHKVFQPFRYIPLSKVAFFCEMITCLPTCLPTHVYPHVYPHMSTHVSTHLSTLMSTHMFIRRHQQELRCVCQHVHARASMHHNQQEFERVLVHVHTHVHTHTTTRCSSRSDTARFRRSSSSAR